jgi:hypothetical protein
MTTITEHEGTLIVSDQVLAGIEFVSPRGSCHRYLARDVRSGVLFRRENHEPPAQIVLNDCKGVVQVVMEKWDVAQEGLPNSLLGEIRNAVGEFDGEITKLVVVLGFESVKGSARGLCQLRTDQEQEQLVSRTLRSLVRVLHKLQDSFPLADLYYFGAGRMSTVPGWYLSGSQEEETLAKVNEAAGKLTRRVQDYFRCVLGQKGWWWCNRTPEREVCVRVCDIFATLDGPVFFQGGKGKLSVAGSRVVGELFKFGLFAGSMECLRGPVSPEDRTLFHGWFSEAFPEGDWGPGGRLTRQTNLNLLPGVRNHPRL